MGKAILCNPFSTVLTAKYNTYIETNFVIDIKK